MNENLLIPISRVKFCKLVEKDSKTYCKVHNDFNMIISVYDGFIGKAYEIGCASFFKQLEEEGKERKIEGEENGQTVQG